MKFENIFEKLKTLSLLATGLSSPNPPVAAVITDLNGNIISEGHTQKVGGNHAEREAYTKLKIIPEHVLFVTLEPCSHTGRTPPCLDLLLTHRPKKVFLGIKDPNPLVRERDSVLSLQKAGIEVEFLPELSEIAHSFLKGFLQRLENKRPTYILKSALSQEGYFSNSEKAPVRLTHSQTDVLTQALRSKVDAIIVGPQTVFRDNPGLNYRGYLPYKLDDLTYPTEPFWNTLVSSVFGENPLPVPSLDSQPYRIFCLSSKYPISGSFIEKQININRDTKTEKIIFLLLDDLEDAEYKKIESLKGSIVLNLNKDSVFEELDKKLMEFGVNSLVVEGGNFLYSLYGKKLSKYDSVFVINTLTSVPNGIVPSFPLGLRLKDKCTIGKDQISLYSI